MTAAPPPAAVDVVTAFWTAVDAKDWAATAALLDPDVVYTVPQTGERVTGRDAVVRFNAEYPGDWRLAVTRIVGDDTIVATAIEFASPGIPDATGLAWFTVADGLITAMEDWWPEPYEPPPGREHLVD